MKLSIHGKQLDIETAVRTYMEEHLPEAVGKYFEGAVDGQVALTKDGPDCRADIQVHVGKGIQVRGSARAGDVRSAFDSAVGHVTKQLRRYKRRLRDHHRGIDDGAPAIAAQQYVLADEDKAEEDQLPDQPVIVAELETRIETLTTSEAVMRMNLASQSVMMFRNAAHGGLNMIYLREDGNIGWIDPRGVREAYRN